MIDESRRGSELDPETLGFRSSLAIQQTDRVKGQPYHYRLSVDEMTPLPQVVDRLLVRGRPVGPRFLHGVLTPMELKVGHIADEFPFTSTRVGVHVSVACCTGCNGGVHDRGLVVINDHVGGPWTGLWVRTDLEIPTPYPRWQRTLFAGGVVDEQQGSTVVADRGWMTIEKLGEEPHHAPPPLPIETADFPREVTRSLTTRGLDGTWVEFRHVTVHDLRPVDPDGDDRLPRVEAVVSDDSGGKAEAWLYQETARDLRPGRRIAFLRGFVHGEEPGRYVLLSDKEEDISLDER